MQDRRPRDDGDALHNENSAYKSPGVSGSTRDTLLAARYREQRRIRELGGEL